MLSIVDYLRYYRDDMKYEIKELPDRIDVFITDLQIHTTKPRKPKPWYFKVLESVRTKKPQRAYTKDFQVNKGGRFTTVFPPPPELKRVIDEAKVKNKRINFIMPEGGAPVFLGKDTVEKIKAEKRKLSK